MKGIPFKGSILLAAGIAAAAGSFPIIVVTLVGLFLAKLLTGSGGLGKHQR